MRSSSEEETVSHDDLASCCGASHQATYSGMDDVVVRLLTDAFCKIMRVEGGWRGSETLSLLSSVHFTVKVWKNYLQAHTTK